MTLAELISEYRQSHNLSQRQMGVQCGLSTGYISLIEKEVNPQTGKPMVPTLTVLNKIAKGMGITIDELIATCDDMPVDMREKPTLTEEGGFTDPLDIELATLILQLPQEKKRDALNYLRYLADRKDN